MVERVNPKQPVPVQLPALQKPPGYRDPKAPPTIKPPPPPPRKFLPPSFPQTPRGRRRRFCRYCCCSVTVILFTLLILFTIAGGFFYLWYKPKLPIFHLQSVKTPRFRIDVRSDGTFLDSQTVARVQVTNPNGKIGFYYDRSRARIMVGDDVDLGSGEFPRFEQRKRNSTMMRFAGVVKGALIDDGVGSRLKVRYRSKKMVVHVEVRTRCGMRIGNWDVGKVEIRVLCDGVLKKLEGGDTPKCKINLLKWFNLN